MNGFIFAKGMAPGLVLVLFCVLPAQVSAQVSTQASQLQAGAVERAENARAELALLKKQAFDELRDLRAIELQKDFPEHTRVSVYLGVPVSNFRLQQVEVSFDDQPPVIRDYTRRETKALIQGHVHRLIRENLDPGQHRVTVRYSGILPRQLLEDKPVKGEISLDFKKTDQPAEVLVPIVPDVFGIELIAGVDSWRAQQQERIPGLSMSRFLRATGKPYDALINLLEIAGPKNSTRVLPLAYDIELAHSYVDFQMREEADEAMRTAFDTGVELEALADVWLRIAELDFERGELSRAHELLQYLRNDLTPELLVRWQDTMSRLLMSEGQFEQARDVLEMGNNSTEVLTDVDLPANQTVYMRFNYAVTLLKTGETARGRTLLERIGRVNAFDEDQRALRDKANLMLGYHFLKDKQGATGKHILERIRIDGPYSNEALLALGWAELAPEGSRQPRALVGDEPDIGQYGSRNPEAGRIIKTNQPVRLREDPYSRIQLGPFRMANMPDTEDQARQRALVPWSLAAKNTPQDPAVQETLIAIPYAVSALGQPSRAYEQYLQAIELLEQSRAELDTYADAETVDLEAITRGDLSALPETPWMLQLLAGDAFNRHYRNYVELRRINRDLQRLAVYGSQGLSLRLSEASRVRDQNAAARLKRILAALQANSDDQGKLAQTVVAREIARQREKLDKYLVAARLGVARFQEQALAQKDVTDKPLKEEKSGFSFWPF